MNSTFELNCHPLLGGVCEKLANLIILTETNQHLLVFSGSIGHFGYDLRVTNVCLVSCLIWVLVNLTIPMQLLQTTEGLIAQPW